MTQTSPADELESLKKDIAALRDALGELAAGVKRCAATRDDPPRAAANESDVAHADGELGVWADLWRKLTSSWSHGQNVLSGVAEEVAKHPLVSITAAFGLGYIIAKLWYRERKP